MRKKFFSIFISFVMFWSLTQISYANDIVSFMTSTYNKALALCGKESFNGWCGQCVGSQLQVLGVNTSYVGDNGNATYDKYSAMSTTSGGYTVNSFSSSSYSLSQFLNYINNQNTSNGYTYIALGFQKGSSSNDGQTFGHALLIYSVCGGTVYYTESFSSETSGPIRTKSISDFCYSYRSYTTSSGATVYQYEGAIWFTKNSQPPAPSDTTAPTVNNMRVTSMTSSAITISADLNDNVGVTRVWLNVYGPSGEKGYEVSASNGTFTHTINTSDYGGAGAYSIHLYAFDSAGNQTRAALDNLAHSFTITFNANGGTTSTSSKSVTYNSTYGILPTPTRALYSFKGWYTSASGGTKITSDTKVTITSNQTLYAQWTPLPPSNLSLSANYTTIPVGDSVTFTYSLLGTELTKNIGIYRNNSRFANVSLNANSGTASYTFAEKGVYSCVLEGSNAGGSATSNTITINVVDREYPVTYDTNGGVNAPSNQIKTFWDTLTLASEQPSRRGYVFASWNTKQDGTGTAYAPGAEYNKNEAITLYAQWTPAVPTVSDATDQTYTEAEITPELEIIDRGEVLVKDVDYTLTYENNINAGTAKITVTYAGDYSESASVEKQFNILQAEPSVKTNPRAKGLPVKSPLSECEIIEGAVIGVNGNNLSGAYTWENGDEIIEKKGTYEKTIIFTPDNTNYKPIKITASIRVYSTSGAPAVCRVTFNSRGGSSVPTQSVVSFVKEPEEPTREGYIFDGWYKDVSLTQKYDFSSRIINSMTLYAKWTEITNSKTEDNDDEQITEENNQVEENNQIILTIGEKRASVFGKTRTNDVAPIVRNDRTMLPARFVAESLGANVDWDGINLKVTITGEDNTTIILYINSDIAYVNGKKVYLDSPAFVENDRTYTPVRFICENLGADVEWNGDTMQVIITK